MTTTVLAGALAWLSLLPATAPAASTDAARLEPLRVGYFLGGRTAILARAQRFGDFDRAGIAVELLTKSLRGSRFEPLVWAPQKLIETGDSQFESKATGVELVEGVLSGRWELGTVGESSFIAAAAAGEPVVAVATLGHDVRGRSGHVFAVRKEIAIDRPEDYRGKVLIARRSGPGDAAFLKEFLRQAGVDLERDVLELPRLPRTLAEKAALPKDKVLLVQHVFEDDMTRGLQDGVVDGGYFHLMFFEQNPELKVVKPLHGWIDPELSSALLICRRDFLAKESDRRRLVLFLKTYIARVRREKSLPPSERQVADRDPRWMGMESPSSGLNYPQYDEVPLVNRQALQGMLDLLRRHGAVAGKALDVETIVDDSLVKEAIR